MAIIQGICPPSRETWELGLAIWKFFPVVSLPRCRDRVAIDNESKEMLTGCAVHGSAMAHELVRHGQDIGGIALQHPRQDRLVHHGSTGLHHTALYHV